MTRVNGRPTDPHRVWGAFYGNAFRIARRFGHAPHEIHDTFPGRAWGSGSLHHNKTRALNES